MGNFLNLSLLLFTVVLVANKVHSFKLYQAQDEVPEIPESLQTKEELRKWIWEHESKAVERIMEKISSPSDTQMQHDAKMVVAKYLVNVTFMAMTRRLDTFGRKVDLFAPDTPQLPLSALPEIPTTLPSLENITTEEPLILAVQNVSTGGLWIPVSSSKDPTTTMAPVEPPIWERLINRLTPNRTEGGGLFNFGNRTEGGGLFNFGNRTEGGGLFNFGNRTEGGGLFNFGNRTEGGGLFNFGNRTEGLFNFGNRTEGLFNFGNSNQTEGANGLFNFANSNRTQALFSRLNITGMDGLLSRLQLNRTDGFLSRFSAGNRTGPGGLFNIGNGNATGGNLFNFPSSNSSEGNAPIFTFPGGPPEGIFNFATESPKNDSVRVSQMYLEGQVENLVSGINTQNLSGIVDSSLNIASPTTIGVLVNSLLNVVLCNPLDRWYGNCGA